MIETVLSEEILLAVFYKSGSEVRIKTDKQFTNIFDEAARSLQRFSQFKAHPQYKYSRTLNDAVQTLILGGSITREGLSDQIHITSHTLGPYGERVFQSLDGNLRTAVDEVAKKIRKAYSPK